MKLTSEQIKKTFKIKVTQKGENLGMFLHPKKLEDLPKGESVHTYMNYEASSYEFKYPDGTIARIFVLWCKKCGKPVCDSRHLKPWL